MSGSSGSTPWLGRVPVQHEPCAKCGGRAVGYTDGDTPHCRAHRPTGIEEGDDATCEGCGEAIATRYTDDDVRVCDECFDASVYADEED